MALDFLYRNLEQMSFLHKPLNYGKDLCHSTANVYGTDDVCKSPTMAVENPDSQDLSSLGLQYSDPAATNKKPKTILPKKPPLSSSEFLASNCTNKFCDDKYYYGNSFLWNSMINNLNYEKGSWTDSNWRNNDWNCVASDLTTNSGTVNSLNEEKNSDIFQSGSNSFSFLNSGSNYLLSKSLSSDVNKNESTAETTPETMVTNSFQSVNLTSLSGYQFPPFSKSFKNVNSFMNNHPPLSNSPSCDKVEEESYKEKGNKLKKDLTFDKDLDLTTITHSNGPPVTMKVYTSWSSDSENTTSVKKSEKVQLVARSGNWIYVRVNSNPNRYGWIPEFTLVESEMLSRKMTTN
ncbi:uncharacterized protein TA16435 [Theileria annulata]|uniref:SH3 domain-containing protein n=1 Tax=Theileria annulata TaxID=5874 RepID=Q4UIW3_THEAN|nr:uncharacterized protein TA16435 [Theileria annulata]CAI72976.1 hypothetical protein TA16435 [Theileria annulata]|eukprot:XP_953654.1 hypothetical protein TA16435 [Theileria annulata]